MKTNQPASDKPNADVRAVLRQTKVEFVGIAHAESALRVCLDWETEGNRFTRKLSGLRHAFRVYAEQLDRVFSIEEHDGLAELLAEHPHHSRRVEKLLLEHSPLRDALKLISTKLERCSPEDSEALENIQGQIHGLLSDVKRHTSKEAELIMDTFNTDIGVGD